MLSIGLLLTSMLACCNAFSPNSFVNGLGQSRAAASQLYDATDSAVSFTGGAVGRFTGASNSIFEGATPRLQNGLATRTENFSRRVAWSTGRFMPTMTAPAAEETQEEFKYEAEVSKVMDIIINSLYSDKDIFLRELVSNASDACDKRRFLSLTQEGSAADELCIQIKADSEANTLTIEDKGVGMTRQELINNLGKIAQSGTKKFMEALGSGNADTNLIGQFGVGFYSAFLVADKVSVITKSSEGGGKQWKWESTATDGGYSITADESDPIESSGTRLVLHLKEEADKYLDDFQLRDMLKRYSEFISFPIQLWTEKTDYEEVPDTSEGAEEGKMKSVPVKSNVWETINTQKPIWMRSPKEVEDEEYEEFYKTTFKAYDKPDAHTHFALEGQVEFRALMYLPSALPWELSQDMFSEQSKSIKLFVKRVFISDKFEDILPRWLTFVRGVVDSEDLPLNVSREILQKSKMLNIIRKRLVRKAIDMISSLAQDEEKYDRFLTNFGRYLKVGVIEDQDNKDQLLKLCRWPTSTTGAEGKRSMEQYVADMKEGQEQIYYVSGTSAAAAAANPALEKLKKLGYEVIFALDQIDEIALQGVGKFEDKEVVDATKENVKLGEDSEEEKQEKEEKQATFKEVTEFLKETLSTKVDKVEVSSRLTDSPSALLQSAWGMSPQMERFMKAQQAAGMGNAMDMGSSAILEINPDHPAVQKLQTMVSANKEDPSTVDMGRLIYDVAAVSAGYEIVDPSDFAKRIVTLMPYAPDATPAPADSEAVADVEVLED